MRIKLVKYDDDWILVKSRDKILNKLILSIKPQSYRFFDSAIKYWCVHVYKAREVYKIVEKLGHKLQFGYDFPPSWKEYMEGGDYPGESKKRIRKFNSPYHKLYLVEDAPMELVKSCYEFFLHKHHPDQGDGDTEKLDEIISAYKEIKSKSNQ